MQTWARAKAKPVDHGLGKPTADLRGLKELSRCCTRRSTPGLGSFSSRQFEADKGKPLGTRHSRPRRKRACDRVRCGRGSLRSYIKGSQTWSGETGRDSRRARRTLYSQGSSLFPAIQRPSEGERRAVAEEGASCRRDIVEGDVSRRSCGTRVRCPGSPRRCQLLKASMAGEGSRESAAEIRILGSREITAKAGFDLKAVLDFTAAQSRGRLGVQDAARRAWTVRCFIVADDSRKHQGTRRTACADLMPPGTTRVRDRTWSSRTEHFGRSPAAARRRAGERTLHRRCAARMREVLLTIARSGTAQVICTTHSHGCPRSSLIGNDGIAMMRKGPRPTSACSNVPTSSSPVQRAPDDPRAPSDDPWTSMPP
jgi:hypothetical protein